MTGRPPYRVEIVGIGAGSPEHLTWQAVEAIRRCDVFLVAGKRDATHQLVALREAIVARWGGDRPGRVVVVPDPERGPDAQRGGAEYRAGVRAWHDARTRAYVAAIQALPAGATVGFLVWGDPAFYDSTIRVVDGIAARLDLRVHITPGISAFQALAAAHGVVLHAVGEPVHITTGRRLVESYDPALGTVVVMLDGHLACRGLVDRHPDLTIHWGAQLGLPSQALVAGRLADVIDELGAVRAATRERDGWVMDVYALSSSAPPSDG